MARNNLYNRGHRGFLGLELMYAPLFAQAFYLSAGPAFILLDSWLRSRYSRSSADGARREKERPSREFPHFFLIELWNSSNNNEMR